MSGNDQALVIAGELAEALPAPGLPAPEIAWPTRREAIRAAVAVACFVGAPALAAAGVVLALFALSAAVLLAPLVAAALTVAAWHFNRVPARSDQPASGTADAAGSEHADHEERLVR